MNFKRILCAIFGHDDKHHFVQDENFPGLKITKPVGSAVKCKFCERIKYTKVKR